MYTRLLRKAAHTKKFTIRCDDKAGWEVSEEEDIASLHLFVTGTVTESNARCGRLPTRQIAQGNGWSEYLLPHAVLR